MTLAEAIYFLLPRQRKRPVKDEDLLVEGVELWGGRTTLRG